LNSGLCLSQPPDRRSFLGVDISIPKPGQVEPFTSGFAPIDGKEGVIMRIQLDKGIWAIALLATLGFPAAAGATPSACLPPLNFSDSEYTTCFTNVRRGADINFAPREGGKGLAVILYDQGNSDALQLATIDPATGKLGKLKSVSLGAAIAENTWYYLNVSMFADGDLLHVFAEVFKHMTPTDPNSPLAGRAGPTLSFDVSFSALGLEDSGEVGIAASAFSTNVNSSVTNWFVQQCGIHGEGTSAACRWPVV
jgi:hypothetical protein